MAYRCMTNPGGERLHELRSQLDAIADELSDLGRAKLVEALDSGESRAGTRGAPAQPGPAGGAEGGRPAWSGRNRGQRRRRIERDAAGRTGRPQTPKPSQRSLPTRLPL